MFPILSPPPSCLPIPSLWVVPVHQPQPSVSCIEPGLATRFIHAILHVSMPFSQNFFSSFSSLFLSSFPFSFLFGLKVPSMVSLILSTCMYCHLFILIASQISRDTGLRNFVLYLSTFPSLHLVDSLEFLTINNTTMRTPLVFHLITTRQIL